MRESRRDHQLPGWLWFFLILPMVLIVALLYKRRRLQLPRGLGERGVQRFVAPRYVEPDSIPLDMSDAQQIAFQQEPVETESRVTARLEPIGQAAEAPAAPAAGQADDLKIIEGIGPSIERLLQGSGIHSFRELAEAPVERLVEILTRARLIHLADPATWSEQARLAAEGKWQDLADFQATLRGGRRPKTE